MSDLSSVTPRYLGSEQKGKVLLLYLTFSSGLASLLLRWKAVDTVFVVLSFSFQVWRYSPTVALVSTPATACHSPSACMIARSSAYAYFLETVVCRSMLKRRGAKTDPCGTPFLRCRNLLFLPFPVLGRVKLRLPTISMIMRTMCLSGSNCSSLQVRPWCHSVVGCCEVDKHSSGLLVSRKAILDVLCQQNDLVYGRPPVLKAHLLPREQ